MAAADDDDDDGMKKKKMIGMRVTRVNTVIV